jgi:HicB_like antitoxin of bacterial toxin-antitoxin system
MINSVFEDSDRDLVVLDSDIDPRRRLIQITPLGEAITLEMQRDLEARIAAFGLADATLEIRGPATHPAAAAASSTSDAQRRLQVQLQEHDSRLVELDSTRAVARGTCARLPDRTGDRPQGGHREPGCRRKLTAGTGPGRPDEVLPTDDFQDRLREPDLLRAVHQLGVHAAQSDQEIDVIAVAITYFEQRRNRVINITVPGRLLKQIDEHARAHGETRSGFLTKAALEAMRRA